MRYPSILKYLHERPLPRNPIWQPGNPRNRLFLPLYWLKIVDHEKTLPEDTVKFECHWQMNSSDVKTYLEKLYNVPSVDVRIVITRGEYMDHPKRPGALSPPLDDRKYAFVQLKEGTFTFPDIFKEKDPRKEEKLREKGMLSLRNKEKNKSLDRIGLNRWF